MKEERESGEGERERKKEWLPLTKASIYNNLLWSIFHWGRHLIIHSQKLLQDKFGK